VVAANRYWATPIRLGALGENGASRLSLTGSPVIAVTEWVVYATNEGGNAGESGAVALDQLPLVPFAVASGRGVFLLVLN
jgi:hypothetical protein